MVNKVKFARHAKYDEEWTEGKQTISANLLYRTATELQKRDYIMMHKSLPECYLMTPDIVNTVIKCYFLLVFFLTPSELINRKSFLSIVKMKSPKMQLGASCPERSSIPLLLTLPVILSWKFQCSRHEPGTLVDKLTKLRFGRWKYHCSIPDVAANFLFAPAFRKDLGPLHFVASSLWPLVRAHSQLLTTIYCRS